MSQPHAAEDGPEKGGEAAPPEDPKEGDGLNVPLDPAVQIELVKVVISNSFEFIRTTAQIQQGLTSLLLTSYITLLVAFCKNSAFINAWTEAIAILPAVFFCSSLGVAVYQAVTYRGVDIVFDDGGHPAGALDTFGNVIQARRHHLVWPALLTAIGMLFFVLSFFYVFIPANHATRSAPTDGTYSSIELT